MHASGWDASAQSPPHCSAQTHSKSAHRTKTPNHRFPDFLPCKKEYRQSLRLQQQIPIRPPPAFVPRSPRQAHNNNCPSRLLESKQSPIKGYLTGIEIHPQKGLPNPSAAKQRQYTRNGRYPNRQKNRKVFPYRPACVSEAHPVPALPIPHLLVGRKKTILPHQVHINLCTKELVWFCS